MFNLCHNLPIYVTVRLWPNSFTKIARWLGQQTNLERGQRAHILLLLLGL